MSNIQVGHVDPTFRQMLYADAGKCQIFYNEDEARLAQENGWQNSMKGLSGYKNRNWEKNPPNLPGTHKINVASNVTKNDKPVAAKGSFGKKEGR